MSEPVGRAVLIAGPTASGKSALALMLAEKLGGEIVNADSMQLYREMRVLTARPSAAEEARVPHHLYGVRDATQPLSAGRWAVCAAATMREIASRGRLPIVVGGSGLYFRALVEGLAPRPSDKQRIARGIEVARATGRPLSAWQREPVEPLVTGNFVRIVLTPERGWLRARCDLRFERMLEEGALEEAAGMVARGLDLALPAMKALGLRPLIRHLAGEIALEEAAAAGKAETRAYAKRQETWFRTQMIAWKPFYTQYSESLNAEFLSFIDELGLTRS